MTWILSEIFALSILIAGVISLVRIGRIDRTYYPFIILIWLASLNEILSGFLMYFGFSTLLNNNIYVLCESLLILWFFKKLKTVFKSNTVFIGLSVSLILLWSVENFIIRNIADNISYYFRICYSFVTVICSITTVNYLIVTERKSLLKMPVFLICIGFITYFTYKILLEAFELYGVTENFIANVYTILIYLNLIVNLLFALAVLWIPRKREYMLLS